MYTYKHTNIHTCQVADAVARELLVEPLGVRSLGDPLVPSLLKAFC